MPPKKEAPKGKDLTDEVIIILFITFFLWLLWNKLQDIFQLDSAQLWAAIVAWFRDNVWPVILFLGAIIVILTTWGIIYNYRKLLAINEEEREIYSPMAKVEKGEEPMKKNDRWERVVKHINSAESSDWRLAIIEADILLDEVLSASGYHGESVGEKLKAVEKGDFVSLDAAWEAHKMRNSVAHRGADFPLNEREAKRAIALYEQVFKEFQMI